MVTLGHLNRIGLCLCTATDGKSESDRSLSIKLLPLLVFFAFGCNFTIIKYAQAYYLNESTYHPYVMAGFLFAFLTSVVIGAARKPLVVRHFRVGDALAGVLLGVVNYVAVYALIKMLALEGWQSSQLYPIYSVEWCA